MIRSAVVMIVAGLLSFGCQKTSIQAGLPAEVKVIRAGGVTVHQGMDKESPATGTALAGYVYRVLDAVPAAYLIRTQEGRIGWIAAGAQDRWTVRLLDGKIRVLIPGGLKIRTKPWDWTGPSFGVAGERASFAVLGVEYLYFKIELGNGKQGWIYPGKPEDRWVVPATSSAGSAKP